MRSTIDRLNGGTQTGTAIVAEAEIVAAAENAAAVVATAMATYSFPPTKKELDLECVPSGDVIVSPSSASDYCSKRKNIAWGLMLQGKDCCCQKRRPVHFLAFVMLGVLVVVAAVFVVDYQNRDADFLLTTQLLPKAVAKTRIFGSLMLQMIALVLIMPFLPGSLAFLTGCCSKEWQKGTELAQSMKS